ncbi:substrate-binding domain-containing protein, partial [Nocardiopsis lucentensis]|uniref:substrate-binding domain-containing protein n=1 Tax=Nocardiopsis lucentensis TaxID=53441 RepID=UPI00037A2050
GPPPFGNGGAETLMYRILSEEPDLDGLPEELAEPVVQSLDKDPERRPRAAELVHRVAGPVPDGLGDDDTTIVAGLIRAHWEPDTGDAEAVSAGTVPTPAPQPFDAPTPPARPFADATPPPAPYAATPPPVPPPDPRLPLGGDGPSPRRWKLPLALGAGALSLAVLGAFGLYAADRLAAEGGSDGREGGGSDQPTGPVALADVDTLEGEFTGAGASFLGMATDLWSDGYRTERQSGVTMTYEPSGSGAGAFRFIAGEVDFGVSEAGLTPEQVEDAEDGRGCPVVQFPVVTGAVAVVGGSENMEGMAFTPSVLGDIYLGAYTNYREIPVTDADQESNVPWRPDLEIVPVRHDDGASTARVFSQYLASRNARWTTDEWGDVAVVGAGDEGVHRALMDAPGTIGFVNGSYAVRNYLVTLPLYNDSGNVVFPDSDGAAAAAERLVLGDDGVATLPEAEGEAYPIMRIVHVFAFECGYDESTATALRDFWTYALSEDGAEAVEDGGYTPLGPSLGEAAMTSVARIGSA